MHIHPWSTFTNHTAADFTSCAQSNSALSQHVLLFFLASLHRELQRCFLEGNLKPFRNGRGESRVSVCSTQSGVCTDGECVLFYLKFSHSLSLFSISRISRPRMHVLIDSYLSHRNTCRKLHLKGLSPSLEVHEGQQGRRSGS